MCSKSKIAIPVVSLPVPEVVGTTTIIHIALEQKSSSIPVNKHPVYNSFASRLDLNLKSNSSEFKETEMIHDKLHSYSCSGLSRIKL